MSRWRIRPLTAGGCVFNHDKTKVYVSDDTPKGFHVLTPVECKAAAAAKPVPKPVPKPAAQPAPHAEHKDKGKKAH